MQTVLCQGGNCTTLKASWLELRKLYPKLMSTIKPIMNANGPIQALLQLKGIRALSEVFHQLTRLNPVP